MPGLSANLISLSKLTDLGAQVNLQNEKMIVSKVGVVCMFACKYTNPYRPLHGLYVLKDVRVAGAALAATTETPKKYAPSIPELWHA